LHQITFGLDFAISFHIWHSTNTMDTIVDQTAHEELRLRKATSGDLDGIAQLAQEAFVDDPERDYRFPYRSKFPEDHAKWTRREYEAYMEEPEMYLILVIEATNGQKKMIVALCVWDISNLHARKRSSLSSSMTRLTKSK
jgi:hypothetical protein